MSDFSDRVRFNWGFHDAVQVVREGWESKNYGFGPGFKIEKPEDVLRQHPDVFYSQGWLFGYYEKLGGISSCTSSDNAWNFFIKHKKLKVS